MRSPGLATQSWPLADLGFAMRFAPTSTDKETGNSTMETTDERAQRGPFMGDTQPGQTTIRTVPILQTPLLQTTAPPVGDPMDVTPPATSSMAPPARTSPDTDANGVHDQMMMGDQPSSGSLAGPNAAAAAAAGAQQPKVVQTAFIHKLYK